MADLEHRQHTPKWAPIPAGAHVDAAVMQMQTQARNYRQTHTANSAPGLTW